MRAATKPTQQQQQQHSTWEEAPSIRSSDTPYEITHVLVPSGAKKARSSVDKTTTVSNDSVLSQSVWGDDDYHYCCCRRPARRRGILRWLPTVVLSCGAVAAMGAAIVFFVLAARQSRRQNLTLDELASHATPDDCWLSIYHQVFDLTEYRHPGGHDFILDHCGRDATEAYSEMHSPSLLELVHPNFVGILHDVVQQGDGDDEATSTNDPIERSDDRPPPTITVPSSPPDRTVPFTSTPMPGPRQETLEPSIGSIESVFVPPPVSILTSGPTARLATTETPTQQPISSPPQVEGSAAGVSFIWDITLVNATELSAHAGPNDCWVQYFGSVYDMTAFVDQHPGGESNIVDFCGMDATAAFAAVHSVDDLGLVKEYLVGFFDAGADTASSRSPPTGPNPSIATPATSVPMPSATLSPVISILTPETTSSIQPLSTQAPTVPEPVAEVQPPSPPPTTSFSFNKPETSPPTTDATMASQITFPQTDAPTSVRVTVITTLATTFPTLRSKTSAPISAAPTARPQTNAPTPQPSVGRVATLAPSTNSPTVRPSPSPVTQAPSPAPQRTATEVPTPRPTIAATPTATAELPESGCFRLADNVALSDVCWYIFYGSVLDLITYMDSNLEGPDVASFACGVDATNEAFATVANGNPEETFLFRRVGDDLAIGQVCA